MKQWKRYAAALGVSLLAVCLVSTPSRADRKTTGALIGGASGAIFGNGLGDSLRGATLGAGAAAVTEEGKRGLSLIHI